MSLLLDVVSGKSSLELLSVPTAELLLGAGGADGNGEDDVADADDDEDAAVAATAALSIDEDILLCCHLTSMR